MLSYIVSVPTVYTASGTLAGDARVPPAGPFARKASIIFYQHFSSTDTQKYNNNKIHKEKLLFYCADV